MCIDINYVTYQYLVNLSEAKSIIGSDEVYHYFYKTDNLVNGKVYFGVHNTPDLDDGYLGSGKLLHRAVDKYGYNNFRLIKLRYFDSKDKAFEYEKILSPEFVEYIISNNLGYNIRNGGSGGFFIGDKNFNYFRIKSGTHNLLTRPDGTNSNTDRVKQGTHNLLTRPDGTSLGSEIAQARVKNGTHHFLTREDGSSISSDKVKNGTHPFQSDELKIANSKRMKDVIKSGNHCFVNKRRVICEVCGKDVPACTYSAFHGSKCKWGNLKEAN